MKCFRVMYSYVHTKLQSHTLVILSANTDLAVLANNRRSGGAVIFVTATTLTQYSSGQKTSVWSSVWRNTHVNAGIQSTREIHC